VAYKIPRKARIMRAIRSRATQMPALPSGAFLELQELNAAAVASSGSAATEQHSGSLGGRVWKSAAALCRWQRAHASLFEGTRVIELGSGTGAVGLYAAGCHASRVILTDGSDEVQTLMQTNVERNRSLLPTQGSIAVARLRWGRDDAPSEPFDWVLASDGARPASPPCRSSLMRECTAPPLCAHGTHY
jgi:predicted nicotinamide N-methyase